MKLNEIHECYENVRKTSSHHSSTFMYFQILVHLYTANPMFMCVCIYLFGMHYTEYEYKNHLKMLNYIYNGVGFHIIWSVYFWNPLSQNPLVATIYIYSSNDVL